MHPTRLRRSRPRCGGNSRRSATRSSAWTLRSIRRMLTGEFTVKRVQALRPRIQEIADDCITGLLAGPRPADLVEALSLPVPSMVICELGERRTTNGRRACRSGPTDDVRPRPRRPIARVNKCKTPEKRPLRNNHRTLDRDRPRSARTAIVPVRTPAARSARRRPDDREVSAASQLTMPRHGV